MSLVCGRCGDGPVYEAWWRDVDTGECVERIGTTIEEESIGVHGVTSCGACGRYDVRLLDDGDYLLARAREALDAHADATDDDRGAA